MGFREVGFVLDHSPYTGDMRVVHIVLAERANEDHDWELWFSTATVAQKAACSTKTVQRALGQMVSDGYLEVIEVSPGKPTRYRFQSGPTLDKLSRVEEGTLDIQGTEPWTSEDSHCLLYEVDRKAENPESAAPPSLTHPPADPNQAAEESPKSARKTGAPGSVQAFLSPALKAYAVEKAFDDEFVEDEAEQFLLYHRSRGNKFVDWGAAWQTWCRNAVKFGRTRRRSPEFGQIPAFSHPMIQMGH